LVLSIGVVIAALALSGRYLAKHIKGDLSMSSIVISDSFDGGNIEVVDASDPRNIQLKIKPDKAERRGSYFSIFTLMTTAQGALGLSLGLALAGWLGFDATATTHDESSAFAIHLAISWVPAVILSIGLFFIWRYPLDERRCAIIARRLQRRT
jgi:MFS family permease|tara:strand:+ start:179 stop:637 length:459 start_codon:yes stop_codon:yes gene_type:complete